MAAVKVLAELLLDPSVTLGPFDSFPQFQELFPPKYRDHPDARLLYRAFQRRRRLTREKVAKDIHRRYKRGLQSSIVQTGNAPEHQSLEQAIEFLESKQAEAEEELKVTQEEIVSLEQTVKSLSSDLEKSNPIGQLSADELSRLDELREFAESLRAQTAPVQST